ncbi:cadherin domain-containing protein [Phthorimaea operculella]|nr:cadherin domain-containing protein [Phthorimaea operculella]
MGNIRVAAVLLLTLTAASTVHGQNPVSERCFYMTDAIPRQPKPADFEEIEWSGGWNDFPLVPADPRDDVCIDSYLPPSATGTTGTVIIHMQEEIIGEVIIAKLNYQGSATPEIRTPFVAGSFVQLGPEIRRIDNEWYLVITQRQDYEQTAMQRYTFDILIANERITARVSLNIENIDDNAPILTPFYECRVPELGEARLTDCVTQVEDADGWLSILPMTFRIDSDRGDDVTFRIEGEHITGQFYRMNVKLGITTALNFETNPLHIFQITAIDSWPNNHTVTAMVQVENVEHRPPRWVEIFAVQQFDEKTNQSFTVRAIDGDTGIDKPIYYRLETNEEDTFFSIETIEGGRSGAIFYVSEIDRDTLERDLFNLSIVAYKYDNESFATEAQVVIIVNDVNDQKPLPLFPEYRVQIMEETPLTIEFDEEFGFHDRDIGIRAQYEVHIESVYPPGAENAFYIAPEVGYQRQTFIMGTLNHSMLDYEDPEFQNITLKVVAIDMDNNTLTGEALVYIDLINWNDELPIFEKEDYTASFNETEGEGFHVATIRATDRDIGDRVVHRLLGNAGNFLKIVDETGDIYVSTDNAFDYHRQNEFLVQIHAEDTLMEPYHSTTTQLTIKLYDINNTPPTLRLPRGSPSVEENVPEGYVITVADQEITATDPDTTALLQFEIDWESSYATKQGRPTDPVEFHGCVDIETIFPNPNNTGDAIGRVVVKEIRDNVTIDFEEFEVLYLTVRVRDLNTVLNDDFDELSFTIIIIDMNDNAPVWSEGTLDQTFRVRERSASGIVIGSVLATDIDGPLYNQVRYTIVPKEEYPESLVKIDFYTGQITVDVSGAIDADTPPRWYLNYTVIASDRCYAEDQSECPDDETFWDTPGSIAIEIIDINNQFPVLDYTRYNETVYIYENAPNGFEVFRLWANDADRDEMYNTVSYSINYAVNARLRDFFAIDRLTGQVYVDYQTNDVLDRDGDEPEHRVFLTLQDNFLLEGDGNSNQNQTEVLIVLLDENDNAPEMPSPSEFSWTGQNSVSESLLQGVRLPQDIYAPDRDEPNTPNSHVGYAILDLAAVNRPDLTEVPQLFNMIAENNRTGELETAMDLRGYWGTYNIKILAYDHGIPQQLSNETYELEIRPYNFHAPEFVFPATGTTVRLARERASAANNAVLFKVNGDILDSIVATDEDGLNAGQVTFSISGNAEAVNYFMLSNNGDNIGTLMLRQELPVNEDIKEFQVTIQATDGGTEPGPLSSQSTLNVIFVPTTGDPIFSTSTHTVSFVEREVGLTERFQLPVAEDPKNYGCTDDCNDIFYRIFDGNDAGHFAVDPEENVIYLVSMLDRDESDTHVLTIAASNTANSGVAPLSGATLTVTVTVREANPRPYFERDVYNAGISTTDSIGRELVTVRATHSEGLPITYSIDFESMQVDETLEAVRNNAFSLNGNTGVLTLNIQPTSSMHGMFTFNVVATDSADETDTALVRIFLISSRNRISIVFRNTVDQIEAERDFIEQTFSFGFNMTCNIDQILQYTDNSGLPVEGQTEIRAHFIQDDLPVDGQAIEDLRNDVQLLRTIQTTLSSRLISLADLVTPVSPEIGTDSVQITVYVLGGLSAILGFLCFILLVTYIIRIRALNRRLEALSMTKYGSVDSGLNRIGLAAPGTNKHAIEGSNPIWNEVIKAPDFDAISDASGDSDLIGIEDLPQFRTDYFPPADDDSTQGITADGLRPAPISNHSNNFGFYTSPFSSDFTNKQHSRFQ